MKINTDNLLKFYIEHAIATAIINNDETGLSDEDSNALEQFTNDIVTKYGHAIFTHITTEKSLTRCEVTNLLCECTSLYLNPKLKISK